jgi:hypothetical protein
LDTKFEILTSSEELKELREKAFDLEEKLSEAKLKIEKHENAKANVDEKNNIPAEIVQQVETKVEAMASLLQTTNEHKGCGSVPKWWDQSFSLWDRSHSNQ